GVGAGASRLVSGTMTAHRRLEERLAEFKRTPSALLFGSGYLATIGGSTTRAGTGEVVFSDELNHASIIDGCRLARAETFVYRHGDVEHLAGAIRPAEGRRRGPAGPDRRAPPPPRRPGRSRRGPRHRLPRPRRARRGGRSRRRGRR